MRTIKNIIVHCSDSDHLSHDNVETIRKWHVEERKFTDIGYHYLILKNGTVVKCRPVHKKGAHCRDQGMNSTSIGICLTGKYEFSDDQFIALQRLVDDLKWTFGELKVNGHRDFSSTKTCPNFEVKEILKP